ncbi:hypothetical protein E4L98_25795 [Duganella callida]|uniref:MaoC-like domain-containing protein n=2 Tax=Duganella callida TaxID=2561932 RepID=A0A4Y9S6L7_9BURK|nr:hypothetical protein E4L98_25795 [Duganella callida]
MLLAGARIVGHTLRPPAAGTNIAPVTRTIPAPPTDLVAEYLAWAGADGRYAGELPPHMVSQWSLPLVGELLLRTAYKLTSVINQGVDLRVRGPLPRGVPLRLSAAIEKMEEAPGRAKVVVVVSTGTTQQPALVETRLHMSFLQPGPRPLKTPQPPRPAEPQWHTAGSWRADRRDGLHFALLTGDFNPIHWCAPLARQSVFKGMVLHGFGSLVRSYEVLMRHGLAFSEIEVRFLKPVPLPSPMLCVQVGDTSRAPHAQAPDADMAEAPAGWCALRLVSGGDGDGDTVHLAGRLR